MKNTIQRTLAFLLVFCLAIPLLPVMPVQAADNQAAVNYNFYNPAMEVTEGSSPAMIKNGVVDERLTTSYPDSFNNVILNYSSTAVPKMGNKPTLSGATYDYQGLVFWCFLDDWVAFKIKSPGSGTFNVSLSYYQNGNNATECSVYILPEGTSDISNALDTNTLVGACNLRSGDSGTVNIAELNATKCTVGDEYIIVFKATATRWPATTKTARMHLVGLTMTPVVSGEEDPVASSVLNGATKNYTSADELAEAINEAASGTEFKLLADELTTEIEIELPENVTLDLNGKTLTATVNATQGTVTDSSNGAGSIVGSSAVVKTGANEVAIKSGNTYKIFDYTMNVEETAEEKDNGSVSFWFKVDLSDAALGLIDDGTTDFAVGATMQWTPTEGASSSEDVALEAAEVTKWAGLMQEGDYWFYLNVTGFDTLGDLAGTLTVTPTISGNAGTPINYSVN